MGDGARVVVLGYASLDYSMDVTRPPRAGQTSLVTRRLSDPWPDCGGAARFVGPLTRRGADVSVISWVGTDGQGRDWADSVAAAGGRLVDGSQVPGSSPVSYLIHSGSDLPACVFDPGVSAGPDVAFGAAMQAAVTGCDWCLCSVSPSSAVLATLDHLPAAARLAWVVKADPDAFPPALRRRLWARSAVIVLGEAERPFLAEAGLDRVGPDDHTPAADRAATPLIVRTAGSDAIAWSRGSRQGTVAVQPLDSPVNTVGAGDVFAGALLGEIVSSEVAAGGSLDAVDDVPSMIATAAQEARRFLLDRSGT